ncbi:MAG: IPT/TIG domain-containing protein [Acidobacteriota bacterium]|nr:IPT/TIG domain-containing protein [Acidobacteriota bacterium]
MRQGSRTVGALFLAMLAAACGSDGRGPGPGPGPSTLVVSSVSPSTGTTFGGTPVTITGEGFAAGATVQIGGAAATDVVVIDSRTLTAKTASRASGKGDVRVGVGSTSALLAGAFTFTAPVVAPNAAPVIISLLVQPPRPNQPPTLATMGDRMTLAAAVSNDAAAGQLSYEWTAFPNAGTFSGSGFSVQWTAPATVTSPQTITLILTVIERYLEPDAQGLPVQREHRVQRSAPVKVHDSVKEIGDMAVDFLVRFATPAISAEAVMHNFSRTCDDGEGFRQEFEEVKENRLNYVMLAHSETLTGVTFAYGSRPTACAWPGAPGDACAKVNVTWTDRRISTGLVNTLTANDYVSAVYESSRWYLCHSKFELLTSQNFHKFFSTIK